MAAYNKFLQIAFIALQVLFIVVGVVLVAVGAYIYVEVSGADYEAIIQQPELTSSPIIIIVVGLLILLISALGIVGAACSKVINRILLGIFLGLVLFILIIEIIGAVVGFYFRGEAQVKVEEQLKSTIGLYNDSTAVQTGWDKLQEQFECCGIQNASDWLACSSCSELPASCCLTSDPCTYNSADVFTETCLNALVTFFNDQLFIVGAIAVSLVVVEIAVALMAFAMLTCTDFKKDED